MSLQALSNVEHRHLRFQYPAAPYAFARNTVLASLLASELGHALRSMPVVFSYSNGKAALFGLMGLAQDENLFINQEGLWQTGYIPAVLRARPFGLASEAPGADPVVVINLLDGYFSETAGTPLFDEDGQAGEFLKNMIDFLRAYKDSEDATAKALDTIAAADILSPWTPTVTAPDGQPYAISGLFQIDMPKFDSLAPDIVASLHSAGALPLIYAHVYSLANMAILEKMAREREPVATPSAIEFSILKDSYIQFN